MRRIPKDPYSVVVAAPIGGGLEKATRALEDAIARVAIEDEDWPYEVLVSGRGEVWLALSWPEGHDRVSDEELAAEAITGATFRVIEFGH